MDSYSSPGVLSDANEDAPEDAPEKVPGIAGSHDHRSEGYGDSDAPEHTHGYEDSDADLDEMEPRRPPHKGHRPMHSDPPSPSWDERYPHLLSSIPAADYEGPEPVTPLPREVAGTRMVGEEANRPGAFRFLDLPPELRHHIYDRYIPHRWFNALPLADNPEYLTPELCMISRELGLDSNGVVCGGGYYFWDLEMNPRNYDTIPREFQPGVTKLMVRDYRDAKDIIRYGLEKLAQFYISLALVCGFAAADQIGAFVTFEENGKLAPYAMFVLFKREWDPDSDHEHPYHAWVALRKSWFRRDFD
ncbi:hypothetical protein GQ43DRAFT_470763 [Delitschia confertaspora ATCC 74209]|uniref:Uncharacterized protein n=1 Tax=Delitschia confertaspora ATCC 74209 TaxID=1513339 RepID=A0A9P4MTJ2_9PLEO|nr:hypothetical protein GQ43DRAFT_470763 [Delitschia confertaspora ATCC 74209]